MAAMTALDRVSVADLDAMFANELPCGGNEAACPHGASATMADSCHIVDESDYKCSHCVAAWTAYWRGRGYDEAECLVCGRCEPLEQCFRPL